ncbi:MAG: DUF3083 family protein [Colwellia sp.]
MRKTNSVFRRHRASVKVYVPKVSRDNHYLIAEMPLTDKLIELVVGKIDTSAEKPYQKFYQKLGWLALDVVEKCNIPHANFVANNRLVRVRHNDEQQVLHTEKQSFFFYCPLHNSTFKGYFDGAERSNKIKFLFLATGENLREDAAEFHEKVISAVEMIAEEIGLEPNDLKVRDHQHLTYDIFAREKDKKESVTHTFREISARYLHQGYVVPKTASAITYAVVSMPMSRRLLKGTAIDYDGEKPFELLYQKISAAFTKAVEKHELKHTTMIANGLSPIVRFDEEKKTIINGDIISLGYSPKDEETPDISSMWEGDKLVDTVQLVFCATDADETYNTYGKFVNTVTQAIYTMAEELNWNKERDVILMRLNQQLLRRV